MTVEQESRDYAAGGARGERTETTGAVSSRELSFVGIAIETSVPNSRGRTTRTPAALHVEGVTAATPSTRMQAMATSRRVRELTRVNCISYDAQRPQPVHWS